MNTQPKYLSPATTLAVSHHATPDPVPGQQVLVEAEILGGNPEDIFAVIKFRREDMPQWSEAPMHFSAHHWRGQFRVEAGIFYYKIEAWVDNFKSWCRGLRDEHEAGRTITVDALQAGIPLLEAVKAHATALDAERLQGWSDELRNGDAATGDTLLQRALDEPLADLMGRLAVHQPDRHVTVTSETELRVSAAPR